MATLATLTPAQRLALRSLANRLDRSFQRYADSREAGDVAGSCTNSGTYVVTLSGEKYLAVDVLVALHRAQHRTAVVSV